MLSVHMREEAMGFARLLGFVSLCLLMSVTVSRAAGIEVAVEAEKLVESCQRKNAAAIPFCLNEQLNRNWKYKLGYRGLPFSEIGSLETIRKSAIGNLFAFVKVDDHKVACKITRNYAAELDSIRKTQKVLVTGKIDAFYLIFNFRSLHHLRLAPYCSIEPAT